MAYLEPATQKPRWIGEIKWSDRIKSGIYSDETKSLRHLLDRHKTIKSVFFTSKTHQQGTSLSGRKLGIYPTALYCYFVGKNITTNLMATIGLQSDVEDEDHGEI